MKDNQERVLDDLDFIIEDSAYQENDRSYNLAKKEVHSYKKQRAETLNENGIRLEKHLFGLAVFLIYILYVLFVILLLVWFFHLTLPFYCHWLLPEDIQLIERILFASTLLSLAGKYFSKYGVLDKS